MTLRIRPLLSLLALTGALISCGGGGDDDPSFTGTYTPGVFPASSSLDGMCVSPRSGTDPSTGRPYIDVSGTTTTEKNWLRSWTNELYLWYSEVPDLDPGTTLAVDAYFDRLKTSATTPSGNDKDRFHFTYPTTEWIALSESGQSAGYGAQFALIASTPPREVVVAYTDPGTPATGAGLARGTRILAIDGVDVVNANDQASVNTLNAGLFPAAAGQSHSFTVQDVGSPTQRSVNLTSAIITSTPVQGVKTLSSGSGLVGYMLFNDHIATAESGLVNAINSLKSSNVVDLVLDIRYNGGGYLDIASELAFMVGGNATTGKAFERLQFNSKHTTQNPVTGGALTPIPFHSTARGFSVTSGQALPTLNLPRVYVLTGPGTCSASESIINGLRGANVQVIQIGSTTCGKPYGFYPTDNCGTTYFTIQMRGVNEQNFGEYPDGFSPVNTLANTGEPVPGCSVADDFTHPLGDITEGRLASALFYRQNGTCLTPPSGVSAKRGADGSSKLGLPEAPSLSAVDGDVVKSPWLENRILKQ